MKKIPFITIFSISFLFLHNSCRNYSEKELIGTYVNNYSENINPMTIPPEAPARIDTLVLLEGNKFTSQCFGEGEYTFYERNGIQLISLTYKEGNTLSGYELRIKQQGLFNSTIILLIDIDGFYYYRKIK